MLFDGRKHILAPVCEQIVSNFGPVTNAFGNLYAALQNSDFEPIDVSLTDGSKVKVSPNNYTSILASLKNKKIVRLYLRHNIHIMTNIKILFHQFIRV